MRNEPEGLLHPIQSKIHRDLRPSLVIVYLKSGLAVVIGGFISLVICGQLGLGISHAAHHWNQELHIHLEDLWSALASGIAFALISPFVLRVLCSPLQFRAITQKGFHAAFVWFLGLGTLLFHHGRIGGEVLAFVVWCSATIVTFGIVIRLIDEYASGWMPSLFRQN